jgi:hypothetical protein
VNATPNLNVTLTADTQPAAAVFEQASGQLTPWKVVYHTNCAPPRDTFEGRHETRDAAYRELAGEMWAAVDGLSDVNAITVWRWGSAGWEEYQHIPFIEMYEQMRQADGKG